MYVYVYIYICVCMNMRVTLIEGSFMVMVVHMSIIKWLKIELVWWWWCHIHRPLYTICITVTNYLYHKLFKGRTWLVLKVMRTLCNVNNVGHYLIFHFMQNCSFGTNGSQISYYNSLKTSKHFRCAILEALFSCAPHLPKNYLGCSMKTLGTIK